MSKLFGKITGCYRGQGGSMHMFSREHNVLGGFTFIGEGIPVAIGATFTSKYKREVLKEADCDHVTLVFFGDGTCNNGQLFELREVAKEAIGRARSGEGPTLAKCDTYRFRGHSLADSDELRDPDLKAIDKKIDEVVEDAVEFADESPVPPRSQPLENVFADPKGFGIGPDGRYKCEDPKFTKGTTQV
ncbi:hypothetical protein Goshw_012759 [Gossypium schwendimanii]|uniref:Dehydrogenase E1 component domain-containing protein n=1 Tax=Gossypium schwendimanii TaxID=34291 RepID=A0A7J9LX51_GOSSC|nr:hypothetical protein [Gossypium schwendimanii]